MPARSLLINLFSPQQNLPAARDRSSSRRALTKIPNSPGRVCRDNVQDVTDTDLDEPRDPTRATIIYTHTDEAPLLATYSFLPIIQAYAGTGRVSPSRPATSRWPGGSSPSSPSA